MLMQRICTVSSHLSARQTCFDAASEYFPKLLFISHRWLELTRFSIRFDATVCKSTLPFSCRLATKTFIFQLYDLFLTTSKVLSLKCPPINQISVVLTISINHFRIAKLKKSLSQADTSFSLLSIIDMSSMSVVMFLIFV